jgi:hypothetical protein
MQRRPPVSHGNSDPSSPLIAARRWRRCLAQRQPYRLARPGRVSFGRVGEPDGEQRLQRSLDLVSLLSRAFCPAGLMKIKQGLS